MITIEFITALFYEVDEQMRGLPKQPEARQEDGPGVSTHQVMALPRQVTSHPPGLAAVSQNPRGSPTRKSFGFCRRVWRVWQKTGRLTCSYTPLCGVARGCASLSVVDGLSGDMWNLRWSWWGPRHGTSDACAHRADSLPMGDPLLLCRSSHFIFDSISSPRVGWTTFSWSLFRVIPSSPAVKKKRIHKCGYGTPASASYPIEVAFPARICRKPVEPGRRPQARKRHLVLVYDSIRLFLL